MSDAWRVWLACIDRMGPIGALVWLGAGDGAGLDAALATGARRIVLVEPDPAHRPALERLAANEDRVSVHPVAIDASDGEAALRLFNWPALSSLRDPAGLAALFPGLREVGRRVVPTRSLPSLLDELDLPGEGARVLRLDAPGIEPVIARWWAGGAGEGWHLLMRAARAPLYAGGLGADDLRAAMAGAACRVCGEDASDPDFVEQWLWFDEALAALGRARDDLEALRARAERERQERLLAEADLRDLRERHRRLSEDGGRSGRAAGS